MLGQMKKPKPLVKITNKTKKLIDYIFEILEIHLTKEEEQKFKKTLKNEIDDLIEKIKQHIKQACEFYLRYKDKPKLLAKEYPNIRVSEEAFPYFFKTSFSKIKVKFKYNEWLFKLAFKEILK